MKPEGRTDNAVTYELGLMGGPVSPPEGSPEHQAVEPIEKALRAEGVNL